MDEPITECVITPAVSEDSKHAHWMKEALKMVSHFISLFPARFQGLTMTPRERQPWSMERLQWDVSWSTMARSWEEA
jgi:hypothetical protein